jgi:1,2-diacylglycerol 3-alpha-glucosyltransferase
MVVASPFPANHGSPGSTREMAEAIAAKGHSVHVVTYHFGEGPTPKSLHIHRIPDFGFNKKVVVGPTWERPLLDLLMVFTLCRVTLREGIDVIHAHNYEGALVGCLAARITRRPLIYNAVNLMSDELPTYNFFKPKSLAVLLAKLLDFMVPRMADHIIAISDELVTLLHAQGIRPDRIQMIPLGINTEQFMGQDPSIVRERLGFGASPLVMYTGILDRLQRIDYLLRSMSIVIEKVPAARLLLVATIAKEEDVQNCRNMIEELGLENHVDLVQNIAFEEIPLFLASADVTVVCRPHCPGFPVKLLNYMAAGKPIVASEGSAKCLQHLRNAIAVRDHDWQGLGLAIAALLQDRALAAQLGQNARDWVSAHLAWPNISRKIIGVYYDLVGRQSHRTRHMGSAHSNSTSMVRS